MSEERTHTCPSFLADPPVEIEACVQMAEAMNKRLLVFESCHLHPESTQVFWEDRVFTAQIGLYVQWSCGCAATFYGTLGASDMVDWTETGRYRLDDPQPGQSPPLYETTGWRLPVTLTDA